MNKIPLLALAFLLLPIARAAEPAGNIATMFRSLENLEIMAKPERIEASILDRKTMWFTRDESKRTYREGRAAAVPNDPAALLAATLVNEKSYVWDTKKFCLPIWNARLKFYRAGRCISADFCFGCDIVVFSRDGKRVGDGSFDPSSDAIFAVIRSLFPDDKIVRQIIDSKKERAEHRLMIERLKETENKKPTDSLK